MMPLSPQNQFPLPVPGRQAPPEAAENAIVRRKRRIFLFAAIILAALAGIAFSRVSFTFLAVGQGGERQFRDIEEEKGFAPHHDRDRLNILLLGIRGAEDPEGGLLTDALVVASVKKSTGDLALISVPRDLWVRMPGKKTYDKINAAYTLGYEEGGEGLALSYAESVVERVTGLALDGALSADLASLKKFIDAIGGITVTLDRPFLENRQWVRGGDMGESRAFRIRTDTASTAEGIVTEEKWVFELPKGRQTLDGTTALYYLRARFSSNDFDRARREQQVLLAIRDKLTSLGVLLNPLRLNDLLRAFEKYVTTDIPFSRAPQLAVWASRVSPEHIRRIVFSAGAEGLLEATQRNGLYALVPKSGNYAAMRETAKNALGNQ